MQKFINHTLSNFHKPSRYKGVPCPPPPFETNPSIRSHGWLGRLAAGKTDTTKVENTPTRQHIRTPLIHTKWKKQKSNNKKTNLVLFANLTHMSPAYPWGHIQAIHVSCARDIFLFTLHKSPGLDCLFNAIHPSVKDICLNMYQKNASLI